MGNAISSTIGTVTDAIGLTDTKATDRAIQQQEKYRDQANRIQTEMWNEAKTLQTPYTTAGYKALTGLENLPVFKEGYEKFSNVESPYRNHNGVFEVGNVEMDPGYQFRLNEGLKAINRAKAARGSLNSGATLKDLTRFSQNYASDEYSKAYDRKWNEMKQRESEYNNAFNRFNYDRDQSYNRKLGDYDREYNKLSNLLNIGRDATNILSGAGSNYGGAMSDSAMSFGNAMANAELHRNDDMKNVMGKAADFGAAWGGKKLGLF